MNARQQAKAAGAMEAMIHAPRTAQRQATDLRIAEDMAPLVAGWIARGSYGKLLELWVKGLWVDWRSLYGEVKPRRISLPTYPFERKRYWLDSIADSAETPVAMLATIGETAS